MSFSALLKDFKAKPKRSADDAEHPAPKRAKAPAGAEEDDGAPEAGPVSRRDADPLPPLVFQIGMNKTGTSSICNLANACFGPGHCVHFTVGDGADGEVPIARRMVENERAGRSLLAGFDLARTRMFTDMEDMRPERGEGAVEGYRRFWRRLRDEHPDARFVLNVRVVGDEAEAPVPLRFVLNVRDEDAFVRSRFAHGDYAQRWARAHGLDPTDRRAIESAMREDVREHHREVRAGFADCPDRLLVYDIDHDEVGASRCMDSTSPRLTGRPRVFSCATAGHVARVHRREAHGPSPAVGE